MASSYGNESSDTSLGEVLLHEVNDHVSLQLAVLGVVLLVVGYFVQFVNVTWTNTGVWWTNTGVWSAILAICGTALILYGIVVYGLIFNDHVSLQLAVLGVVLLVAGFFVQFVEVAWTNTGVWSAIMAIWGTFLLFFGVGVYGLIWWSHQ